MALAAGVPMKVISNRLRHSSPHFTAKFYGDVLSELSHDAAEAIAARLPVPRTGAVPRTVFLARIAGFEPGGMGTVSNDFKDREST
jgi:hypothetical protein